MKTEVIYDDPREATVFLDKINMPWVYDTQKNILYTE